MAGIYVTTKLSQDDCSRLKSFVDKLPLPIGTRMKESEYHITLAYSKEGFDYEHSDDVNGCAAKPISWDIFGSDEKVLVLRVSSEILQRRFTELCGQGYKCKFPDYKAHITVATAPPEAVDVSLLPLPEFDLTIVYEYAEPLEDGYEYDPASKCESQMFSFQNFIMQVK